MTPEEGYFNQIKRYLFHYILYLFIYIFNSQLFLSERSAPFYIWGRSGTFCFAARTTKLLVFPIVKAPSALLYDLNDRANILLSTFRSRDRYSFLISGKIFYHVPNTKLPFQAHIYRSFTNLF